MHPETFLEVLSKWGCEWMWDNMQVTGENGWLRTVIQETTLIAITNGLYMQDLYPNMNSCAFILECTQGRGCLTGAFSKQTIAACFYGGDLLGLMAIHLILLSVNRFDPKLTGSVHIYLACLGALNTTQNLPPHWIPSNAATQTSQKM
jgi:hypothetical protein